MSATISSMNAAAAMQSLSFSRRLAPSSRRISSPPVTVSGVSGRISGKVPSFRSIKCVTVSSEASIVSDAKRFAEASNCTNLVPIYRCIFSDQLTPVLAYRCLVKEDDREAPSFLFESVEPGSQMSSVGRYSVVGAQPAMEIVAKENKVIVMDHKNETLTEEYVEDPMTIPKTISDSWKPDPQLVQDLPDAFCGGWVGFFSYDTIRYVEKRKLPFSKAPEDDRNLPDIHLGLYDDVIVFDHVEKKAYVIHWIRLDGKSSFEKAYSDGTQHLEKLVAKLQDIDLPRLPAGSVNLQTRQFGPSLKKSNMTCEEYKEAVVKAKEHILAGDIFQIVLSQRFERRTFADPFEVYRALRVVNPSPYMGYLQARGCIMVASSPEILTRVKKNKIVNRPLAGTSRRGKTATEDEMFEKELLNNEKQCAEHIMLVDLGRNDVGKVAKYGSVKVEKLMNIERYSHVMHISSTVTGELQDDLTCWDTLRAALPVGTVSGAPKVKAMELIDEFEATRRGPYSGGFGGVSFTGDMDIALALRTIVFPTGTQYNTMYSYKDSNKRREWVAYLQAGAGIVADSDPDDEHRECQNKAAGLARAIDLAESAFVNK
ncbi:PREDICTED: anthranilate synthase alpha subunit 1, chloroplastic [Tarenaya hassleriana]|uniref:anthranilate synthase alpha subunit 1, chloroplastic n=1 Tax=Tarenaya hassleriana TaxID=28532 RepID=UPI00053C5805|nr:PREDICTED: anthranilate synthase alpha subunit 1, chloroplastic [Tarenaya hassleriana]